MGVDKTLQVNVADYIAEFLNQMNINKVHGLMGGGASGLNDGFIRNSDVEYLCYHHEQAAGYAALGEIRLTKRWGVLNPTTGCGGTNAYTPVLNAWQDSLPLVIISGNVGLNTLAYTMNKNYDLKIRAFGVQENDIISNISSITKYATLLEVANNIEDVMIKAFVSSAVGRNGPSWIDIPADIQHTLIDKNLYNRISCAIKEIHKQLDLFDANVNLDSDICIFNAKFMKSSRPTLLIGGGVSNNKLARKKVAEFVEKTQIPVVATYSGTDVIDHDYDKYLGTIGIKGNRAANFAVQNCDLLFVLGSRLPFGAIGYDIENFAKNASLCIVDLDADELEKNRILFPGKVTQLQMAAQDFIQRFDSNLVKSDLDWLNKCVITKEKWGIIEENKQYFQYEGVSIYHVMEELNSHAYDLCNFVIDAGSISYVGPTALKYKVSRNFIFSPAQADMGCALPSALGVAANSKNRTICVTGDGSFMSNMQELASFAANSYDLTLVILNNSGYLSISNTQKNNYGANRMFGEHHGRGLKFPNYEKLCAAFGLSFSRVNDVEGLSKIKDQNIKVVEVVCQSVETIAPYQDRVDGQQAGAHDMAPFRDKNELIELASVDLKFAR